MPIAHPVPPCKAREEQEIHGATFDTKGKASRVDKVSLAAP